MILDQHTRISIRFWSCKVNLGEKRIWNPLSENMLKLKCYLFLPQNFLGSLGLKILTLHIVLTTVVSETVIYVELCILCRYIRTCNKCTNTVSRFMLIVNKSQIYMQNILHFLFDNLSQYDKYLFEMGHQSVFRRLYILHQLVLPLISIFLINSAKIWSI